MVVIWMMIFLESTTFVFNVLNWKWKNLNSFIYTLCSYVLKLNKWKHLLFMTFLKSPDSLTHPVYVYRCFGGACIAYILSSPKQIWPQPKIKPRFLRCTAYNLVSWSIELFRLILVIVPHISELNFPKVKPCEEYGEVNEHRQLVYLRREVCRTENMT